MSTVMPSADGSDNPGEPLKGKDELLEYFASGEKSREAFKVGTEHEKFGFLRKDLTPLPFEGAVGIGAIFDELSESDGYQAVKEDGNTIALFKEGASVTLEPGGQLELSGAPLKNINETCEEVGEHLELLKKACIKRGVGFIGIGFHPTATWEDMGSVPKQRYGIMRRYMPKVGGRGLDMMKRTCTVQANFDYESEKDMVKTMQSALVISPVITALFANSPFYEGKASGNISERAKVWGDTDGDRSGFPQVLLDADFSYEKYLEYTLDVPMYFIRRDQKHLDYAGASFRTFMNEGIDGHRATLRDYKDHLTAVFPEVRLKHYLEVRGADCGPWSRICALPAIWKGILYDEKSRDAAYALMDSPSGKELTALHQDVALRGFKAEYRETSVLKLAEALVDLADAGLGRLHEKEGGPDERGFLKPCRNDVEKGETFADHLLDLYNNKWDKDLTKLYDEIEFWS